MSSKIISSINNENPDLRKQIGCMNGIFQLFDRHYFLPSRRTNRHTDKKLLPGSNNNVELNKARHKATERNAKELLNEKHRASYESSRTSTSSSFSSFDHQSNDQISSTKQTLTALNIRDVVKDSMYREARKVLIKTVAKEEGKSSHVMKHIDSPRPLPLPNQKARDEKDGLLFQARPKEPRRFSYDGSRELKDSVKSSVKLKELPRLSLDSRKGEILNLRSSVITKLMGLEALPDRSKALIANQVPVSPRVLRNDPASPRTSKREVSPSRASSTIYSEIEKRISEIEFKRSGKDLRALKQILESMQKTRQKIESQNDLTSHDSKPLMKPSKRTESSIVIMKPVKLVDKYSSLPVKASNLSHDATFNKVYSLKKRVSSDQRVIKGNLHEPSWRFSSTEKKNAKNSIVVQIKPVTREYLKNSGSISPKSLKKHESSNLRKATIKTNLQRCDSRKNKVNCEIRSDDSTSFRSEITSTDYSVKDLKKRGECKDITSMNEQPSPVSVLEAKFYREDSTSPLKKFFTAFTDDESIDTDEANYNLEYTDYSRKTPSIGLEFNNKKLENIKELIQKLELLNPTPKDRIVICDSSNLDHKYITKIILASGLLKNVSRISIPIQLHSSGHVINPKLFYVLEQTEGHVHQLERKIHRKIVFDTVNEILVHKLSSENLFLLGKRTRSGQELMKQLHSEWDHLQNIQKCGENDEDDQLIRLLNADMMYRMGDWVNYKGEFPTLVLDIERLIFKDLISEVINDEILHYRNWTRPRFDIFRIS